MARTSIATDAFGTDDLATNWTNMNSLNANSTISGGVITDNYAAESVYRWTGAGTFTDDQYAKDTVVAFGGQNLNDKWGGVIVRADTGDASTRNYYLAYIEDTTATNGSATRNVLLCKMVNSSKSTLATTARTTAPGDTIALEVTTVGGNAVLAVFHNDVQVAALDYTDSSSPFTTGKPGLTQAGQFCSLDNWEGGDVTGASSTPIEVNNLPIDSLAGGEIV